MTHNISPMDTAEDPNDAYYIGLDEEEVLSSAYHGNPGFATLDAARASLATYPRLPVDLQREFRIFRVTINPVKDGA